MARQTDKVRLQELAHKWLTGTLSVEEQQEFDLWFNQVSDAPVDVPPTYGSTDDEHKLRLYTTILNRIDKQPLKLKPYKWFPYAAAILLIVSTAVWYFARNPDANQWTETVVDAGDVSPGRNRATLTFADGRTVPLSESQTGIIIGEGITYLDGSNVIGERHHQIPNEPATETSSSFTLTTPKGGTYQLTLSDGTVVWLNAESTLIYPSRFAGNERVVELVGEAYFEVSKATVPFKVKSTGQEVEVLGTTFNISAYPDEPETKTTLVEGKVKVVLGTQLELTSDDLRLTTKTLTPGQQAITHGAALTVHAVDTEPYTAWKDGYFNFGGITPVAAFAQLERWYDIDVAYQGEVPEARFFGIIERDKQLSSVLEILKESGLAFKVIRKANKNQLLVINE